MGKRGPKPEPASVKLQKGNPGRRPVGADPETVHADGNQILPPDYLKDDALGIWWKLVPRLVALKLMTEADVMTFGRYCLNYARWLSLQKRLDDGGMFYEIETASGTVRRSDPAFAMADRLDKKMESVEDRFGLNPAERQRIFAARAAGGAPDLFTGNERKPVGGAQAGAETKPRGPIGFLQ